MIVASDSPMLAEPSKVWLIERSDDIAISSEVEVVTVTNVLIRGVSDEAVARIDAESAARGLSRNEFLRRKLEGEVTARPRIAVTREDWRRSAEVFADLADPDVMDDAWR